MPIDMRRVMVQLIENALSQPQQSAPEPAKKQHLSTGRAMMLGAGMMAAGQALASSRGREVLGTVRERLEPVISPNGSDHEDEDYDDAEAEEDFDDEEYDDDPEAEYDDEDDGDFDDEEDPEAEEDDDFDDEDEDDFDDEEDPEAEEDDDFDDEDDEDAPDDESDEDFDDEDDEDDEEEERPARRRSSGRSRARSRA